MKLTALLTFTALAFAGPALADDTLDRGIGSEWTSLDPHVNFDAAAAWIQSDAYEGLVNFGPSGEIVPGQAESWEISEDGKIYTFHLRAGLKWSNGDPVTAQQFVDGILRTLDPATASDKAYVYYSTIQITGAAALNDGSATDAATLGVKAPDDKTVVVQLDNPAPFALDLMGSFYFTPLHGASYGEAGSGVFVDTAKLVTNGAYVISEIVPQSHALLTKNPNYWDAANVKIDKVKYHVTEDVTTELKRYQAGEIDITYDVPLGQLEELKASGELHVAPTTEVIYYSFNLTRDPFKDIKLRRALTLAIDRETLENKIVKGGTIPSYSYAGGFDPTYQGPVIAEATMTQDEREALAKQLYAEAGYGPDNPLKLKIVTTVAEDPKKRSQGVAIMWKQVLGVEAEVQPVERSAWFDAFYAGDWDVFADDLVGDFAGPETFLAYMRPSTEPGYNWVKPEYDAAMDEAAALTDKTARYAALAKAEKLLLDDYLLSPGGIYPSRRLVKSNVKGWSDSVAGYNNSQWMSLE
jgi:oligopeptide transport system substrate-binding protein